MTSRAPTLLLLAAALLPGCASQRPPRAFERWESTVARGHPLAGRVWDVARSRWADEATLGAAAATADFVVLGEVHDNPDHHRLQAMIVRAIAAAGRTPALGFEMLDAGDQAAVDEALARAPKDPDAVAEAVGWAKTGWPPFSIYRPVFEAGLEAGLPVVATNLSREEARAVAKGAVEPLSAEVRAWLERAGPLPEAAMAAMRDEMRESHCNALPESLLDPLIRAQRARDAQLAERLAAASDGRGAVLVTGNGHARTDRAVPDFLRRERPGRKIVAIAFLEVEPDAGTPQAYAEERGGALPYDFVMFTPGAEREDPCEALRSGKHPPKISAPPAPPPPPPPAPPPEDAGVQPSPGQPSR